MGLDVSHGCWEGAYSAFTRWRTEIARLAGVPLWAMEGFYEEAPPKFCQCPTTFAYKQLVEALPVKWESLKPDPLHLLLNHSDCGGDLRWQDCEAIAARLEELLPQLPTEKDDGHIGDWREKTQKWIDGLRSAAAAQEDVKFY